MRSENIIFEEVVKKLGLETEKHPSPYKLAGNKKGDLLDYLSKKIRKETK